MEKNLPKTSTKGSTDIEKDSSVALCGFAKLNSSENVLMVPEFLVALKSTSPESIVLFSKAKMLSERQEKKYQTLD